MIVKLKMPFKNRIFIFEKEVKFMFRIATLELVCEHLKIEFWQLFEKQNINNPDTALAIIWCSYLTACKELYKKPKYTFANAVVWQSYMSEQSRKEYTKHLVELLGKLKPGEEIKEGGEKKN